MSIANTEQAEHWNTGDEVAHWTAHQARYDRMLEPFTDMIFQAAALRPGGQVLDVGCGCGATVLAAARLAVPGQAVGIDLSGPMLARARARAEAAGLPNALFLQDDAQVHAFDQAVGFVRTGSIGRTMLAEASADTVDRAVESLRAALAPYANANGVHLGAGVWLVGAVAP